FFFQAEDGIRDRTVTGVQTCALPISLQTAMPLPVFSSGVAGSTPAYLATSPLPSHGSPIDFYMKSINGGLPDCATDYGFALSMRSEERRVGKECRARWGR